MKKILCLLLAALMLSGCKSENEYEDYVGGNNSGFDNPIMETESGYYGCVDSFSLTLCYYDKATEKTVFLCSKPECAHDGNEYCNATRKGLSYCGNICLSGDYIYFSGQYYDESDGMQKNSLYRAKTDGTELTEICNFYKLKCEQDGFLSRNQGWTYRTMLVHRKWAVIPFEDASVEGYTLPYCCNTAIVNIETGEYKILPEAGFELEKVEDGVGGFYAYGDWLYYTVTTDFMYENKQLYRYNFITGNSEKIDAVGKITSYIVTDNKIYYTTPPTKKAVSKLWTYSLENGEITDLSAELKINGTDFVDAEIMYGGDYLILYDDHHNSQSTGFSLHSENKDRLLFMTKDGEALREIDMRGIVPSYSVEGPEQEYFSYELKYCNGVLYAVTMVDFDDPRLSEDGRYNNLILCCSVEDIVSGTGKWTEPYDFFALADKLSFIWEF